jgi:hypothetical protein
VLLAWELCIEVRDEILRSAGLFAEALRNTDGTFLARRCIQPLGLMAENMSGDQESSSIAVVWRCKEVRWYGSRR